MRIKLIKIGELDNATHKNNIEEGRVEYGEMVDKPEIGKRFTIVDHSRWFSTSLVQKITDEFNFETLNSHYRIEIVDKLGRLKININLEEDGA